MAVFPETLGTYVYFKSLMLKNPEFAKEALAYSTFNLHAGINNAHELIQPIQSAIEVLRTIANTEEYKKKSDNQT